MEESPPPPPPRGTLSSLLDYYSQFQRWQPWRFLFHWSSFSAFHLWLGREVCVLGALHIISRRKPDQGTIMWSTSSTESTIQLIVSDRMRSLKKYDNPVVHTFLSSDCTMTDNGKCCKFPFVDNDGVRYGRPVPLPNCRQPYCATEVDSERHVTRWSFVKRTTAVPSDCKMKTIRGECCKFPFKERKGGKEYSSCLWNDYGAKSCATQVDKNGVMTAWDTCAGTIEFQLLHSHKYPLHIC